MEITFSKHALERMTHRGITHSEVQRVIQAPDSIITKPDYHIYQSLEVSENKSEYLYRVFVNTKKDPSIVITVYKI